MNGIHPAFLPTTFPWAADPLTDDDLTRQMRTVLRTMYLGAYGSGRGVVYSEPGRREPYQTTLKALARLGAVDFYDAKSSGWERGMWGARLTCVGANTVFRAIQVTTPEGTLDEHPRCGGGWRPNGTCTSCTAQRPLDADAYLAYVDALSEDDRTRQINGPRLYCLEHGWVRTRDITTQKVCRLTGTDFHDGGLQRV